MLTLAESLVCVPLFLIQTAQVLSSNTVEKNVNTFLFTFIFHLMVRMNYQFRDKACPLQHFPKLLEIWFKDETDSDPDQVGRKKKHLKLFLPENWYHLLSPKKSVKQQIFIHPSNKWLPTVWFKSLAL